MAQCVVCTSIAHVYCLADKCFLCQSCDKTIHEANIISRSHRRLPTCALCKRSAAAVYCKEDEAALCEVCEKEVHSANPLGVTHTVVPIDTAMACGLLGTANGAQAAAAGAHAPAAAPAAAASAEDAQSSAHISSTPTALTELLPSPDASFVVPDMAAPESLGNAMAAPVDPALKGFKDLDALDFEAAWFGNLDMNLDFSDILGNVDDLPGMVPTADALLNTTAPAPLPAPKPEPTPIMPAAHFSHPSFEDDFVVPSFLPEDLSEDLPSVSVPDTTTIGVKRSASFIQESSQHPPAKIVAPPPPMAQVPLAPPPPAAIKAEVPPPPSSKPSGSSLLHMNGANLTREQRVARYREKRKNRKFQKTIRYASRKAYAEVRPRIKGRFATKEEVAAWEAARAAGQDIDIATFVATATA